MTLHYKVAERPVFSASACSVTTFLTAKADGARKEISQKKPEKGCEMVYFCTPILTAKKWKRMESKGKERKISRVVSENCRIANEMTVFISGNIFKSPVNG